MGYHIVSGFCFSFFFRLSSFLELISDFIAQRLFGFFFVFHLFIRQLSLLYYTLQQYILCLNLGFTQRFLVDCLCNFLFVRFSFSYHLSCNTFFCLNCVQTDVVQNCIRFFEIIIVRDG